MSTKSVMLLALLAVCIMMACADSFTKECSVSGGYCLSSDNCCKGYACMFYANKCVKISPFGGAQIGNQIGNQMENQRKCGVSGEYCLLSDDCCKGYACLTYASKCVRTNPLSPVH